MAGKSKVETTVQSLCCAIRECRWEEALRLLEDPAVTGGHNRSNKRDLVNAMDQRGGRPLILLCDQLARRNIGQRMKENRGSQTCTFNILKTDECSPTMYTVCRKLIDSGADVHAKDKSGQTPLMKAARGCDLDLVKILLSAGAGPGVNEADAAGNRALTLALSSPLHAPHKCAVVSELLANGADPLLQNWKHETAFESACTKQNSEVLRTLLKSISSLSDAMKYTLARRAIQCNSPEVLDVVKSKFDIDSEECWYDKEIKESLLLVACKHSNQAALGVLSFHHLAVTFSDSQGKTPLMHACANGDSKLVYRLCRARVEKNNQDISEGKTALIYAAPYPGCVKVLLDYGADISLLDQEGKSALIHAIESRSEETVEMLLAAGAEAEAQDYLSRHHLTVILSVAASITSNCRVINLLLSRPGCSHGHIPSALIAAITCGSLKNVSALVRAGADVNRSKGKPLRTAINCRNDKIVKFLLNRGARVDLDLIPSIKQLMASRCSEEILALLLRAGSKANGSDLCWVAGTWHYSAEIVRLMIETGCHVNYPGTFIHDLPVHSALNVASRNSGPIRTPACRLEVCNVLLSHGAGVNRTDLTGRSVLHIIATFPRFVSDGVAELTREFLDRGTKPNLVDINGKTALMAVLEDQRNYTVFKKEQQQFVLTLLFWGASNPVYSSSTSI